MIELADVRDVDQAIARCRECAAEECDCPVIVAEMGERIEALRVLQQRRDDA